jgi:hypothetical protein
VRVHDIERHLHRIERESVVSRDCERIHVDAWILVSREADVANLPCLSCFDQRPVGALLIEDPMRIFEAEHLVMLYKVDAVRVQPAQRLVELPGSLLF